MANLSSVFHIWLVHGRLAVAVDKRPEECTTIERARRRATILREYIYNMYWDQPKYNSPFCHLYQQTC